MADMNNTAVIDEIKPINKVTFKQRMISYKRKPLSLVMLLLVALAAVLSAPSRLTKANSSPVVARRQYCVK